MAEFMVMVLADETADARLEPAEIQAMLERQTAYERTLRAAGAYLEGERLRPTAEGRRVRRDRIETGPFLGTLSSYYFIEAIDLDAALAYANQCPVTPGTALDVRPVMKGQITPDKTDRRGKVFAFGVIGSAATERGWIEVMDRIDACTHSAPHTKHMLGGVRLREPTRAVFDGPFLEAKEVIGGIVFMQMATIEEAIAWARQSEFMHDATLEIRELWRS